MENTLENKAKFFAQYWGQKVMVDPTLYESLFPVNSRNIEYEISDPYLELTPLSQISDEDAKSLSIFCGYKEGNHIVGYRVLKGLSLINYFPSGLPIATGLSGHSEAIDFLRSKCYALPWMGLSIEQQIELGWVKLK